MNVFQWGVKRDLKYLLLTAMSSIWARMACCSSSEVELALRSVRIGSRIRSITEWYRSGFVDVQLRKSLKIPNETGAED
jgi:hypothetical protein